MLDTVFAIERADESPVLPAELGSDELREECLARASIYRLLAGVFVEEPSREFLLALRDETLLGQLAAVKVNFAADFLSTEPNELAETLACEYATLFASSGGSPPVESVRLTGRFKQEPHFRVSRIYHEAGFTLNKGRFEVFADQLGVELLFGAELLERCAAAIGADQPADYRRIEKDIKRFWTQHLGLWVRGYSRLISRASNHSFYREMAKFLGGFAEEEIAAMGLKRLEDLDLGRVIVPKSEIKVEFNPDEPVCGGCPPATDQPAGNIHKLHDLRF